MKQLHVLIFTFLNSYTTTPQETISSAVVCESENFPCPILLLRLWWLYYYLCVCSKYALWCIWHTAKSCTVTVIVALCCCKQERKKALYLCSSYYCFTPKKIILAWRSHINFSLFKITLPKQKKTLLFIPYSEMERLNANSTKVESRDRCNMVRVSCSTHFSYECLLCFILIASSQLDSTLHTVSSYVHIMLENFTNEFD